MNCEEARLLLDAYIDGELSDAEKRALEDHAQACEACARELEAAELLRDALSDMGDEIVVPLEAQAAWRSAVRTEAKKKNSRRWMRAAYAVAAALVVLVGVTAVLPKESAPQPQLMTLSAELPEAENAIIARDGAQTITAKAADAQPADYTVWKKIAAEVPEEAKQSLEMLAAEYSGSCTDAGAGICRIELPYEYMEDFLSAASRVGEELFIEITEAEAETAVILIQINEA